MQILELELMRFVTNCIKVADSLIEEFRAAETPGRPEAMHLVEAWIVLNAGAVIAAKISKGKMEQIRQRRNTIRSLGVGLERNGVSMIMDIPDTSMAFLVAPREEM